MGEKIEPALSAEEWDLGRIDWRVNGTSYAVQFWNEIRPELFIGDGETQDRCNRPEALIALANAALPDSDPRKITREWVRAIRNASPGLPARRDDTEWITTGQAQATVEAHRAVLDLIADALESYLPPA